MLEFFKDRGNLVLLIVPITFCSSGEESRTRGIMASLERVQLKVVRVVAVLGGLLQSFLFMCICGITASLCGGKPSEGVFDGVLLSMSSTVVVLKFLMEKNSVNVLHGQVTIGTLILQILTDCTVGLLFALLPVLGGTSGVLSHSR
ncbi:hypothetical protein LXL04_006472 [Taraxacum kok-saghyz]